MESIVRQMDEVICKEQGKFRPPVSSRFQCPWDRRSVWSIARAFGAGHSTEKCIIIVTHGRS